MCQVDTIWRDDLRARRKGKAMKAWLESVSIDGVSYLVPTIIAKHIVDQDFRTAEQKRIAELELALQWLINSKDDFDHKEANDHAKAILESNVVPKKREAGGMADRTEVSRRMVWK
jgi:hypothetical protein